MRIRSEQMAALEQGMLRRFEKLAVRHLRLRFPDSAGKRADDEFLGQVSPAIQAAKGYGIKTEADILRYLEFETMYGPNFPALHPETEDILMNEKQGALGKLRGLDDWEAFSRPERADALLLEQPSPFSVQWNE